MEAATSWACASGRSTASSPRSRRKYPATDYTDCTDEEQEKSVEVRSICGQKKEADVDTLTVTPFEQAIEFIEQLSPTDQEAVLEIVRHRLIEKRRHEIAANAQATLQALREGRARYGTVDDLRRDLQGE